ncbi:MAG TPA: lactate utilization protein [Pyrinomonadaceae bacterium]|nr:lactate utilization protein [Pyrinomonadaceae bacterium]
MNNEARQEILSSIATHLAASAPFDARETAVNQPVVLPAQPLASNLIDLFKQNIEAVDGHCIIAHSKGEIADALTQTISALQKTKLRAQRIAISDAPEVERLMHMTDLEIEELGIAPSASEIFGFDVGITTAQAAIAETGTLVLDSARERHRFVSLVPPVHIAIVDASTIYATLGETLTMLQNGNEVSPAVTFVTGPSRTADIELTLTIGVHGPQELYVIINQSR